MRLPRDISGRALCTSLSKLGYSVERQTGSHIRLVTQLGGQHHVTVPDHDSLKVGTINGIPKDVAHHAGMKRDELIERLFG